MLKKYLLSSVAFAPDADLGVDEGAGEAPVRVPLNESPADGPGSGRGTLRKQLESSVDSERKGREKREGVEPPKRAVRAKAPNHQEPEEELEVPEAGAEGAEAPEAEGAEGAAPAVEEAPASLSKEAKAEWAKTPASVRASFIKREQDVERGVNDLKKRYADIDQALAPRMQAIRQNGHTPAAAVNQLFAWMEALQSNPQQAFPALAQSFKFDLRKLIPAAAAPGAAPAAGVTPAVGEQPEGAVPPAVQQYIDGLKQEMEQKFGGLRNDFTTQMHNQSMEKTQQTLDVWSNGKPYFEEVRQMMAHLIGSNAVAPLPNGAADLDKAYDMALYALPDVRAKVLAEQEQAKIKAAADKRAAEKLAQDKQAAQARRASGGSLQGGAPGNPVQNGKKPAKGKTVRESLMEARAELAE